MWCDVRSLSFAEWLPPYGSKHWPWTFSRNSIHAGTEQRVSSPECVSTCAGVLVFQVRFSAEVKVNYQAVRCCNSRTIGNCQYGHSVIYFQLCVRNKSDFRNIFLEPGNCATCGPHDVAGTGGPLHPLDKEEFYERMSTCVCECVCQKWATPLGRGTLANAYR